MVCGGRARPMSVRRSGRRSSKAVKRVVEGGAWGRHFLWGPFVISAMMKTRISKVSCYRIRLVRLLVGQDVAQQLVSVFQHSFYSVSTTATHCWNLLLCFLWHLVDLLSLVKLGIIGFYRHWWVVCMLQVRMLCCFRAIHVTLTLSFRRCS